jgi:hypothetical protein
MGCPDNDFCELLRISMRCQKSKRDGNMCKASALIGKKYCALHFEEGRAAKLGSIGGRRRAIFNPDELKRFPAPKTAAHVRDLLAQSMVELRAGELDPRIASSICCLVAEFLKTLELCTLEEVIEPLEREREERDAINGKTEGSKTKN